MVFLFSCVLLSIKKGREGLRFFEHSLATDATLLESRPDVARNSVTLHVLSFISSFTRTLRLAVTHVPSFPGASLHPPVMHVELQQIRTCDGLKDSSASAPKKEEREEWQEYVRGVVYGGLVSVYVRRYSCSAFRKFSQHCSKTGRCADDVRSVSKRCWNRCVYQKCKSVGLCMCECA